MVKLNMIEVAQYGEINQKWTKSQQQQQQQQQQLINL